MLPADGQVHPEPAIDTRVNAAGGISVTVTAPLAGCVPALLTVMAYVSPVRPGA